MMKNYLNFALAGCARISSKHLDAIEQLPESKLVAVCDVNEKRLGEVVNKYNPSIGYGNYQDMLRNENIDVVIICTPSGLHPEMTIEAADAGKDVIVEKPMALNLADADDMIEACDKNSTRLFVVKQYRHHLPVIETRKALDRGRFGEIYQLSVVLKWTRDQEYFSSGSWRGTKNMDGGIFLNQAIHHLDLLRWFGGPIKRVYSIVNNLGHPGIETDDTGVATVEFESGALGSIDATICTYPRNLEGAIAIYGKNGSVKIGGLAADKTEVWEFRDYTNEDGAYSSRLTNPASIPNFAHRQFYQRVKSCILENDSYQASVVDLGHLVDGFEGRKSLELAEAIYKSSALHQEVYLPIK